MSVEPKLRYSKVSRRIWDDGKFRALSAAKPNGQTLFLRLLTGPELTCIPGLFPMGEAAMAEALGWDLSGFRYAFGEVIAQGLAKADWNARLVWVPNAIKHNPPQAPNTVTGWGVRFRELPDSHLKAEAHRGLKAFVDGLGDGFRHAFAHAFPDSCLIQDSGFMNQDPEEEAIPKRVDAIVPKSTKPKGRKRTPAGKAERAPSSEDPSAPAWLAAKGLPSLDDPTHGPNIVRMLDWSATSPKGAKHRWDLVWSRQFRGVDTGPASYQQRTFDDAEPTSSQPSADFKARVKARLMREGDAALREASRTEDTP